MDKDYIIYIILFALISIGALRQANDKKELETKVRDLEERFLILTVQHKRLERKLEALKMRSDSLYLQSNL